MSHGANVDALLIQWGDRLFYPANRMVKARQPPHMLGSGQRERANAIRARIEATVTRRAPQVMVKVTGGGRGIKAIAAHFRYISKNGRIDIEDENGTRLRGPDAVHELTEDWRLGGSLIEDSSPRREAFNIMLSMPRGSAQPITVLHAARAFARAELAGHKYVMVLHDHQTNPHVHISVRAESKQGLRLNPRKADLHRWRERFAEALREQGIEAEATRQATRGTNLVHPNLWQVRAAQDGRLLKPPPSRRPGAASATTQAASRHAWEAIADSLGTSGDNLDRLLARSIRKFVRGMQPQKQPEMPAVGRDASDSKPRER
jgi:hypothetical protein